jgi:AP-1 complex subunit gamma-1
VSDELASSLVSLISKSPEIQGYTTSKLHGALKADLVNVAQTLVQVGVWCVGEYADMLKEGAMGSEPLSSAQAVELLEKVLRSVTSSVVTKEYTLNALVKLAARYPSEMAVQGRVRELIAPYRSSIALELQQRAVEYAALFQWDGIRVGVLERMPPMEKKAKPADAVRGANGGGGGGQVAAARAPAAPAKPAAEADLLADILGGMDMGGMAAPSAGAPTAMGGYGQPSAPAAGGMDMLGGLMDLLGGDSGPPPMQQQQQQQQPQQSPLAAMGGMGMGAMGAMGAMGVMGAMGGMPAAMPTMAPMGAAGADRSRAQAARSHARTHSPRHSSAPRVSFTPARSPFALPMRAQALRSSPRSLRAR